MRTKSLIHVAVLMDIIGLTALSLSRSNIKALHGGILGLPNLPLAITLTVACLVTEFSLKKASPSARALFFLAALPILVFSFYLPPTGAKGDLYAVFSYATVILQVSIAFAAVFMRRTDIRRIIPAYIIIVFVFSSAAFGYTFTFGSQGPSDRKYDVAVVLGAEVMPNHTPSPLLIGRLDAALRLYRSGLLKKIAVTGAGQAGAEKRYLQAEGVPDSNIIAENRTHCTCEQADFVKTVLVDSLRMRRIAIVTDSWQPPQDPADVPLARHRRARSGKQVQDDNPGIHRCARS